jgi:hypothetical protein
MVHINLNSPDGAKKIENIMNRRCADLVKMAGIEFFRQVIISTPVDTGRARMGWSISVNAPSDYLPAPAPDNWKGRSRGGSEYYPVPDIAKNSKLGVITVNDKVFITNNVPYMEKLNKGYSRQEAARFVERAAARVQAAVNKLWKKIK